MKLFPDYWQQYARPYHYYGFEYVSLQSFLKERIFLTRPEIWSYKKNSIRESILQGFCSCRQYSVYATHVIRSSDDTLSEEISQISIPPPSSRFRFSRRVIEELRMVVDVVDVAGAFLEVLIEQHVLEEVDVRLDTADAEFIEAAQHA